MRTASLPRFTNNSNAVIMGRYHLLRTLGHSTLADVYCATDLERLRPTAIKISRPAAVAHRGVDRLAEQIAAAANLEHRHLLPIDDVGVADGLPFYTMPNADGRGLRTLLTEYYRLPLARATAIAMDVADALEFAHRRGIVHGHIRPENIFLVNGRAMLADCGIGNNEALALRPSDDVFGVGGVLYEMLTGEPPETGFDERVVAHARATDSPSLHHTILAALPDSIIRTLTGALAATPSKRFEHGARFRDALAAAVPPADGQSAARLQPAAA